MMIHATRLIFRLRRDISCLLTYLLTTAVGAQPLSLSLVIFFSGGNLPLPVLSFPLLLFLSFPYPLPAAERLSNPFRWSVQGALKASPFSLVQSGAQAIQTIFGVFCHRTIY